MNLNSQQNLLNAKLSASLERYQKFAAAVARGNQSAFEAMEREKAEVAKIESQLEDVGAAIQHEERLAAKKLEDDRERENKESVKSTVEAVASAFERRKVAAIRLKAAIEVAGEAYKEMVECRDQVHQASVVIGKTRARETFMISLGHPSNLDEYIGTLIHVAGLSTPAFYAGDRSSKSIANAKQMVEEIESIQQRALTYFKEQLNSKN